MDGAWYIDTVLLRQHVAEMEQERDLARQLCEALAAAGCAAVPEFEHRYRGLTAQAEGLERYFGAMAGVLDQISTDADLAIRRVGRLLEELLDTNSARTVFRDI